MERVGDDRRPGGFEPVAPPVVEVGQVRRAGVVVDVDAEEVFGNRPPLGLGDAGDRLQLDVPLDARREARTAGDTAGEGGARSAEDALEGIE